MTSIGISFPGPTGVAKTYTSDDFVMPMLIDTASTLSYIRADVVAVVAKQLNATLDAERNYVVDCALRQQNGTIDFGFNNGRMLITVSYRDFIWQQLPNKCLMGFQVAEQGTNNFVLGDTFLRGAYCAYSLPRPPPFRKQGKLTGTRQWYSIKKSTSCGWLTTTTAGTVCKWSESTRETHSTSSASVDRCVERRPRRHSTRTCRGGGLSWGQKGTQDKLPPSAPQSAPAVVHTRTHGL